MLEIIKLSFDEYNQLINASPNYEQEYIKPYDFFEKYAWENMGLIIDNKPVYFGALTLNKIKNRFQLWTRVNSNVKEQFSLYKVAKKIAYLWAKKYKEIYCTMPKDLITNLKWTKQMGFIPIEENDNKITLVLKRREKLWCL